MNLTRWVECGIVYSMLFNNPIGVNDIFKRYKMKLFKNFFNSSLTIGVYIAAFVYVIFATILIPIYELYFFVKSLCFGFGSILAIIVSMFTQSPKLSKYFYDMQIELYENRLKRFKVARDALDDIFPKS